MFDTPVAPRAQRPTVGPSTSHHGYSDSTLSSGRSSDDGRSSFFGHSRQESGHSGQLGESQGHVSVRGSHEGHTSSGEEFHSRNNSHDSNDYTQSGRIMRIMLSTLCTHDIQINTH